MKKKAIEKIGYLGLPGTSADPDVRFIGVTAVMDVSGEKHFFLEIYRNDGAAREIPVNIRQMIKGVCSAPRITGQGPE